MTGESESEGHVHLLPTFPRIASKKRHSSLNTSAENKTLLAVLGGNAPQNCEPSLGWGANTPRERLPRKSLLRNHLCFGVGRGVSSFSFSAFIVRLNLFGFIPCAEYRSSIRIPAGSRHAWSSRARLTSVRGRSRSERRCFATSSTRSARAW